MLSIRKKYVHAYWACAKKSRLLHQIHQFSMAQCILLFNPRNMCDLNICVYIFSWRARMCWPPLCLCRPLMIFTDVWIRTQSACREKQALYHRNINFITWWDGKARISMCIPIRTETNDRSETLKAKEYQCEKLHKMKKIYKQRKTLIESDAITIYAPMIYTAPKNSRFPGPNPLPLSQVISAARIKSITHGAI